VTIGQNEHETSRGKLAKMTTSDTTKQI